VAIGVSDSYRANGRLHVCGRALTPAAIEPMEDRALLFEDFELLHVDCVERGQRLVIRFGSRVLDRPR
jgi:hypothetical protein